MSLELVECLFSYPASFGNISPACRGNSPQASAAQKFARDTPATAVKRIRAVSSVVEHLVYTESLTNTPILSQVPSPVSSIGKIFWCVLSQVFSNKFKKYRRCTKKWIKGNWLRAGNCRRRTLEHLCSRRASDPLRTKPHRPTLRH